MALETKKDKEKNDLWSSTQVYNCCEKMQIVERDRAADRALIDNQFNGGHPYTAEEVKTYQIHVNVNWNEGKNILLPAVSQLNNALIFKERFFSCTSKGGKTEKKQEYGDTFTRLIHEPLKNGLSGQRQMFLLENRNMSVALHGPGPILWMNGFRWRGRFIPLEDLLIPTDALCDFSNLMFFAVNLYLTAGEFFDMTHSDKVDKNWNITACRKILDDIVKPAQQQAEVFDYMDRPEHWVEWMKQNRAMWDLDAATTVKVRMFFYKDPKSKKWHRCVIMKERTKDVPEDVGFLYDGRKTVFADSISHILHVQYGDNNIVPPRKFHSCRGLGVDLYAPVECNNRLRCEFVQHVLFQLKTLLKISNPSDRARPKMLDLSQYTVVPDGVSMISANERYQVDPNMVQAALSQVKQMMGESSSSYVKDSESSTVQPRTATETSVLANEAREQVSNMLQSMYAQEEFYWQEEVRRFCDSNSEDEEVQEFQKRCVAEGIPKELMKSANWAVKIERTLGGGDQFMAVQEAGQLLGLAPQLDPPAQRIVKRKYITTLTRDPKMGELLVPTTPDEASDGMLEAEDVFGTLMQGIPVSIRHGIERTDYTEALLGMTTNKVQQIDQTEQVPTMQELVGLQAAIAHITENLQILEQDPTMKQQVKQYGDLLGEVTNGVKMLQQRFEEQQGKEQIDPEVEAKIQTQTALAQNKMQISQEQAAQKMQQRQMEFEQKMAQAMEQHRLDMMTAMTQANTEIAGNQAKTVAEIANQKKKADAAAKAAANKPAPAAKK